MRQSLALRQKQKLTPQLIQTMGLIAQNSIELQEYIAHAIESNPALRIQNSKSESFDELTSKDSRSHNHELDDYAYVSYQPSKESLHHQIIEGTLSQAESLQDHLLMQLHMQKLTPEEIALGDTLIQNLDDHGFHREPLHLIVSEHLNHKVEKLLFIIQRLDPIGTGVTDVQESLEVQAKEFGLSDLAVTLIQDHLYDIHMGNLDKTAKDLQMPLQELNIAIEEIQQLTPYPGIEFSKGATNYVAPDLEIVREGEKLSLILRDEQIPSIELDPDFLLLSEETEEKEASTYIKKQISDAEQLMQMIDLRNVSLMKVGAELLEKQQQFFLKGKKHLVALTQKEVAESLDLSDSTISRIANGKYIQTEWGLFPIKYFFTSNLVHNTNQGEKSLSRESIKVIISEIIEEQDGKKRVSDEKIRTALQAKGITIARRTVAKYRNELAIESSFERH